MVHDLNTDIERRKTVAVDMVKLAGKRRNGSSLTSPTRCSCPGPLPDARESNAGGPGVEGTGFDSGRVRCTGFEVRAGGWGVRVAGFCAAPEVSRGRRVPTRIFRLHLQPSMDRLDHVTSQETLLFKH